MRRRLARTSAVAAVVAGVLPLSIGPAVAATFGSAQRASAPSAWNAGEGLAVSTHRLFSVWASDCPPPSGACSTNAGPWMGVFVQLGAEGSTPVAWKAPRRVSQIKRHAERASIAADGAVVIVGWVTQTKYVSYRPRAPRVFWIRVSRNEGATWGTPIRMSPLDGRVDYPRLAASAGHVYAVWTDANTGAIRLASSADRGRTWLRRTVGTSSMGMQSAEGFAGLPDVGASGAFVGVSWIADQAGTQMALTSETYAADLGATSSPTTLTTSSPHPALRYPAVGGSADTATPLIAFAYATLDGIAVRAFDGGKLGPEMNVLTWGFAVGATTYVTGYGPAVVPSGGSTLLVAVAACRRNSRLSDPCIAASGARVDVVYTESADDGHTWLAPRALTNAANVPYRVNDEPSIAITTGGIRRVAFDRYQRTFTAYNVGMRSGS